MKEKDQKNAGSATRFDNRMREVRYFNIIALVFFVGNLLYITGIIPFRHHDPGMIHTTVFTIAIVIGCVVTLTAVADVAGLMYVLVPYIRARRQPLVTTVVRYYFAGFIWFTMLKSSVEMRKNNDSWAARWANLRKEAAKFPSLRDRMEELYKADDLVAAVRLVEGAKREREKLQRRTARWQAREAERRETLRARARAAAVGIDGVEFDRLCTTHSYAAALALVEEREDAAETERLKVTREGTEKERERRERAEFFGGMEDRINKLVTVVSAPLLAQLAELRVLPWNEREFRIARYALIKALEAAEDMHKQGQGRASLH